MTVFIAHRGLSAYAPENTLAAFELAWAQDCAGIELDVQVSADGIVLVHHDETTQRMSGIHLPIATTPWSELAALSLHNPNNGQPCKETIPRLEDVLNSMPSGKIIQVEIKPEVSQVGPIIALLQEARRDIALWVISFNADLLRQVHHALPGLRYLWVLDQCDAQPLATRIAQAQAAGFDGIDVHQQSIDRAYAAAVHAAGLTLACWIVDDPARAQVLQALGVDMIASNVADRF